MAEKDKETVTLEIEGTRIECSKNMLMANSYYFSAMFQGCFKESYQETIQIRGVSLKIFNTILMLLWNNSYVIEEEELHLVLEGCCMLQFDSVKDICLARITEMLKPSICFKIWKTAEMLQISPLWIKAKSMALTDFDDLLDNKDIFEFTLDDICSYLGHIYLNVKNELTVFQTAMNWWYENHDHFDEKDCTKIILRLLNCVEFNDLTKFDIKEMQSYPDIATNTEIKSVLDCVMDLQENGLNIKPDYSEEQLKYAIHLCNSKQRKTQVTPCLMLQSDWSYHPCRHKGVECEGKFERRVVAYDKYRCKRICLKVLKCAPYAKFFYHSDLYVAFYDEFAKQFHCDFLIPGEKVRELVGYKLLPYKEYIFLFGGEYFVSGGLWNSNFWTYDVFKEKWERKNMLPYERRNFESLVIDSCVYIIGGVGNFRKIQENLIYFDYKTDKWSDIIALPVQERFFKCCSYKGELFIVFLTAKSAYSFDKPQSSWRKLSLEIDENVVLVMRDFAVFANKHYIYIQGRGNLLQYKLVNNTLVKTKQIATEFIDYEDVELVVCNNNVYTLYKIFNDNCDICYSLEVLDLETDRKYYIFRNVVEQKDTFTIGNKVYCTTRNTKLFSINYYRYVGPDLTINDPIM